MKLYKVKEEHLAAYPVYKGRVILNDEQAWPVIVATATKPHFLAGGTSFIRQYCEEVSITDIKHLYPHFLKRHRKYLEGIK